MSVIKKLTAAVAAVAMAAVAASCSGDPEPQYFFAMDTYIELKCDSEQGMAAARQVIENAGGIYDRHLDSSAVSKLNRERTIEDRTLANAVKISLELYKKTDGYFDISLGQVISAWDIGGENRVPSDDELEAALQNSGTENINVSGDGITLSGGVTLDFGAIAKGIISDEAVLAAKENGAKSATFSLGGNIALIGDKGGEGYSVGIADPNDPQKSIVGNIIGLADCFAVTSGGYQRYFEQNGKRYCHIFGKDGKPADSGLLSVTIVSKSGAAADAYSTALYSMGLSKSLEFYNKNGGFEAVFVTDKNEVVLTDGLKNKFKLTNGEYKLCD